MAGVILAAGKGARMLPFSEHHPKPILPILNRPLLSHQIDVMRDCGIHDIYIVVGHLGYHIASMLGGGERYGVMLHFVGQQGTLGLAHAVGALEPKIQLPFLLKAPVREAIDEVLDGRINANLISMYEPDLDMVRRNFVIKADETRRVSRVIEKPRYVDSQLKGCGLYVFDQHIFDAIRRTPRTALRDEYEITDSIQILIDDGYEVHHKPIVERDLNLTKPDDLLLINLIELRRQGLTSLVDGSVTAPQGVGIANSVVGPGVRIRHPIRITNSVIMAGVEVESSVDLDAVVMSREHIVQCPALPASLRV